MSKLSTFNYLINSYQSGKKEIELFHFPIENTDLRQVEFEPSQRSINAILSFASQYEVLESKKTGNVELNLN